VRRRPEQTNRSASYDFVAALTQDLSEIAGATYAAPIVAELELRVQKILPCILNSARRPACSPYLGQNINPGSTHKRG